MGKGDKRSKRGKIILGSHGKSRPKKVKETVVAEAKPTTEAPAAEA